MVYLDPKRSPQLGVVFTFHLSKKNWQTHLEFAESHTHTHTHTHIYTHTRDTGTDTALGDNSSHPGYFGEIHLYSRAR